MIARRARTGAASLLAALLLAVAVAIPGMADAAPRQDDIGAPEVESGDAAIDDLVGCVQGSRRLLVLFLIDESASLQRFDPQDRRVDAARTALDSLIVLGTVAGDDAAPEVEVAFAAFAHDFRLVRDWTGADDGTADSLDASLGEFAALKDGEETDFVNALAAGREVLADRAAAVTGTGGASPCRLVLMFTDGGYALAVREDAEAIERLGGPKPYAPDLELTSPEAVAEAEEAGRAALCDPDGLADRLRNDDVTLLTVALSGEVDRASQVPLAAASAGRADDVTCGTPRERPSGAYLPAEDLDVLITRFNEVGVRLAGGSALPGEDLVQICGDDEDCSEGSRTFQLDATVRRVQIVALAPDAAPSVLVQGPNGARTRFDVAGDASVGPADASVRSLAGRGFAIDLVRPDDLDAWSGSWTASVTDPSGESVGSPARLQIFLFSDLSVELGPSDPLERGGRSALSAVLVAPEGVEAADIVASVDAEIRLEHPLTGAIQTVALDGPPTGPFLGAFETPADTTVNALVATAELRIETTGGARILTQSGARELLVRRAEGSIQFAPPSLEMLPLTGLGTTDGIVQVLGGAEDGCIWFGPTEIQDPPDGIGEVTFSRDGAALPGEDDCLAVPAGESIQLLVEASPESRASGTVRGALEIYERTEGVDGASVTQVPFRFDLARGVDETRRLMLTVLLLLGGLALPLLALLVINALTARFQALDAVQGTALPVVVSGGSVSRNDGPHPRSLALRSSDFGSLAGRGNDKRFSFGGVVFRARASRNPFGATIALAAPEGGAEKLKGNEGSRVELDPGLSGSWVFLLDPNTTAAAPRGDAHGLLIAFVAEGEVDAQVARMLPDIQHRLPTTADRLMGLVRQAKRKGAKRAPTPPAAEPLVEEPVVHEKSADDEPVVDEPDVQEPVAPDEPSDDDSTVDEPVVDDDDPPRAPPGFSGGPRP